jgi:hypothetical protein
LQIALHILYYIDPKALRAEITSLKAELAKAAKNNQHPQSTPIDPKAIEAVEIRGWNAGVEATHQALIAKGRTVSRRARPSAGVRQRLDRSSESPAGWPACH